MTRIAVNGLGRIGKLALRRMIDLGLGDQIVLLNDAAGDADQHALLMEFDSVHGRWPVPVTAEGAALVLDGHRIPLTHHRTIDALPLRDLGVDESHDFRSPGSRRTKRVKALKNYCKVRRILTGTATSNSPLAAYSQFNILADGALGHTRFSDFEADYAIYVEKRTKAGKSYQALESYRNLDGLQEQIAKWASVVLREDVDDMPELVKDERTVVLPDRLMDAYRTLVKEFIVELEDGGEVEAIEGGARLIKLQQILSGWVIDSEGNARDLVTDEENPRLQALLDEVQSADRKCIVWCKYREDIRRVVRTLTAAGKRCVEYHGAVHSQSKRQEAIDLFNLDPSVDVFVGQPKAGGQGLDLSAADLILWYSHTFDLIERDQANERATQIGGRTVTLKDFVTPGTVDEYILTNLNDKRSVSDALTGRGLRDRLLALFRTQL